MMKNMTKKCTKCEEIKPLTEFYKQHTGKYGVTSRCKECERAYQQSRNDTFEVKVSRAVRRSRQKAKELGVESTLTLEEVHEVLSGDHCDYCNKSLEMHEKSLEHVIPYEYGGENTFGNVTLACTDCNRKKHAAPAFEFILLNGDANAARRLLYVLAERNGIEPQDYLYALAQAGIKYRTARLYRIAGVEQ